MRPPLRIREAEASDLAGMWGLEQAVFGADAWSEVLLRQEVSADHRLYLVLAKDDGTILGYGGLFAPGEDGDIQTIALDPAVRGEGWGRTLMAALLDEAEAKGTRRIFLEVRADNPVARGLYASLGFQEVGVRQRYYQPDDVDAIVMRLEMGERR